MISILAIVFFIIIKKQLYNSINNQFNYDNIPNQIHTNSNISIIHFNARSLIKLFNSITNYLYSLHHKFDIIVISETWLNEYNKDLYFIVDYNNIHITRIINVVEVHQYSLKNLLNI